MPTRRGKGAPPAPVEAPDNFQMKEAILYSVPKFGDDGKILFRDHECALSNVLTYRREYIQTESLKKTIVLESLIGRAVLSGKCSTWTVSEPLSKQSLQPTPRNTSKKFKHT